MSWPAGTQRDHPDQWSLEMLNTILGEGSSSRLFQELREEAGLAYDVHSFQVDYADSGSLQVYAGVDPENLDQAITGVLNELRRLRDEPVGSDELERARSYAAGRLELRLEESRHLSAWLGVQEALHDRVLTPDDVLAELNAVTPDSIHALAQRLLRDELLCLTVIAPARLDARCRARPYPSAMTERTLILIKPDGVQRALVGRIIERYEQRGLRIAGMKLMRVSRELAEQHYDVHRDKPFFPGLIAFITSSPVVALAVEGPNAVARLPRDQRRHAPGAGRPGQHPWRSRPGHRPQPRARLRFSRDRRARGRPVVRTGRAGRLPARQSTPGSSTPTDRLGQRRGGAAGTSG